MNLKEMLKEAIKKMTSLRREARSPQKIFRLLSMRSKISRLRSRQQRRLMR